MTPQQLDALKSLFVVWAIVTVVFAIGFADVLWRRP